MNLGWKLAATINGWAPDGLLDTYTEERHPVGAWALDWTRAQVAMMRPNPHSRAIAGVIRDLINTRDGTSYFVEKISGVSLRYNLAGDHPLIGRSVPDFEFDDGSRVGESLHGGLGLLLDFDHRAKLGTLCQKWPGRVTYSGGQRERPQRHCRVAGETGWLCRVGCRRKFTAGLERSRSGAALLVRRRCRTPGSRNQSGLPDLHR
jgi:hypothetical protein